jgi:hypothetical protein
MGGGGGATGGGAGDAGCVSDFACASGQTCDPSGDCVAGVSCSSDVTCQSLDPQDRCYRYGRQCTCDAVCRVRKAPCDECTADLECGSDVVIFGPPDGPGAGRCRTLPNDTSGKKHCSYQRVGQCGCGLVDDGSGFCRPSSNSCAVVACDLDSNCPSNTICRVPDGGAGCSGTCIPRVNCFAFNSIPVARLTACSAAQLTSDPDCALGATISANYSLASINPDVITVSGVTSTDDSRVVDYKFTLLPPIPGGATTAALANHGVRGPANKTALTIPAAATGVYRVGMVVYDDCGQASGTTAVISVNISP